MEDAAAFFLVAAGFALAVVALVVFFAVVALVVFLAESDFVAVEAAFFVVAFLAGASAAGASVPDAFNALAS